MVVVGPGFVRLGRLTGTNNGIPDLQMAVYPGPFDLHTREAITANTIKDVVPQIIKVLTTPLDTESAAKAQKKESPGKEIVFTGTLEEVNRYFTDAGWSDGMAIFRRRRSGSRSS